MDTSNEYKKLFGSAMPQIIHDIRNPLNVIIGFSSIMQVDDSLSEENKQYLQKINQSGLLIENMLSDIDYFDLDLSDLEFDDVNVLEVCNACEQLATCTTLKDVQIIKNCDPSIEIYSVPDLIKKIINGLFGFSYKGFKTSASNKKIYLKVSKNDTTFSILYGDTTNCIPLEGAYFSIDESVNARRGIYPIFIKKFVDILKGKVTYLTQKQWATASNGFAPNTDHGFIIELPLS